MSTNGYWRRWRARVLTGAVGAGAVGLVATLALAGGPATADAESGIRGWSGGWPLELTGDEQLTARVARATDEVIKLRARTVRDAEVDADGNGEFSPGDYFVFEDRLFRGGEQVGRDSVRCMVNHRSILCDGTIVRGSGNIEVSGAFLFRERGIHLAVTGGTGAYRDAAGTFTVKNAPGRSDRIIIRLVD